MVNDAIALNLLIDTGDLCQVNTFSVQDIELKNFKIMISPFEHQNVDGLLGMNFFKRFKFFLNQKEAVLYLSEKE